MSEGSTSELSWSTERSSDALQVASASAERPGALDVSHLEVPGFLPAILLIPSGSEPRPLVAAAHGAGGSPEWECEYWARLTAGRAFVLCLRGTKMGGGSFYYKSHYALRDELAAALSAARQAHSRIAKGGGIYAGFSQGASFGSLMIAERGADFPYVVLIEGFTQWNIPLARTFAKHGGRRVSFVCGTEPCATKAELSARALQRADLEARAQHATGAGHTPVGEVMQLVEGDLPWLVADDPLWR
jgi:predicted esterase